MTLKEQLQQSLARLNPFAGGEREQLIEVDLPAQQLRCQLVALDSLACAFSRLALRADRVAVMSADQLQQLAEGLSRRLTYLLEPISPIETDAQGCVVQMRSNPPQKDTDGTSYYELLVSRSGELSLMRYNRPVGGTRQSVSAHVTREVLLRLADDFSQAAG
jgi:hypothetical protein